MPKLPPQLVRWPATAAGATFEHTRYDPDRGVVLEPLARLGSVTGAPLAAAWSQALPSWQADAPPETALEIMLRGEIDGRWTRWYTLGLWSSAAARRQSVVGQEDDDGRVATDTLLLRRPARAMQWRVVLHGTAAISPALRLLSVALGPVPEATPQPLPTIAPLAVPELSQMVYPDGGPVWCSPTSLAMVLGYWFQQTGAPRLAPFADPQCVPALVAPAVYDPAYEGTGNWPFNTAYAATLGLSAYVVQLSGLRELGMWLASGVPLVASIAWQPGELDGAAIGHSGGHLLVVVGLDRRGDVVVNDPAADPGAGQPIRRSYPQAQFRRAWDASGRMAYLIGPRALLDEAG